MEARKCAYCNGAIPSDKRADSKFCSTSCKAAHWEENKGKNKAKPEVVTIKPVAEKQQPKPAGIPLDGLRGIVENTPKTDVSDVKETSKQLLLTPTMPVTTRVETQAYREALAKKQKAESDLKHIQSIRENCIIKIREWQGELGKLNRINTKPIWRHQSANVDAIALQEDQMLEEVGEQDNRISLQKKGQEEIAKLRAIQTRMENVIPVAKGIYEKAVSTLNATTQYEPVKLVLPSPSENKPQIAEPEQEPAQTAVTKDEPVERTAVVQSSSKLISSRELREMNYKCLNFQGKWKEFFGLPAVVFHLAVHGKPGEGKSTFCIQFADYLAKNFGYVVYISGEEGFSKTLRDKVVNNKIDNPYLFFADISSYEQIPSEIENNKFHFIFIDSLDTLRIDAARLRELREHYPQSAFITISQSTKDGKMRGSQEIIHDTDIAVKVEDGIATTTKNRYHPRGTEFEVFKRAEKPAITDLRVTKNII